MLGSSDSQEPDPRQRERERERERERDRDRDRLGERRVTRASRARDFVNSPPWSLAVMGIGICPRPRSSIHPYKIDLHHDCSCRSLMMIIIIASCP